jgi:hypothetical protein
MRVLIVYESMYGNTHAVADRVAAGFRSEDDVRVVPVRGATPDQVDWADLLIVGGPTHVHGLSRPVTRTNARDAAAKPGSHLTLDPSADGPGLREWFKTLGPLRGKDASAFDTRLDGPAMFTGRASKAITRDLQAGGARVMVEGESFLINRDNVLLLGETERAARWGATLATTPVTVTGRSAAVGGG